jgi:hypothetical protein
MADNEVLRSEPRIRAYLNELVSEPVTAPQVYGWSASDELRAGKLLAS